MKKALILSVIITILFTVSGCKSLFTEEGRLFRHAKSFEKSRQYDDAVERVVQALVIDPEYKKAIKFLKETYPDAVAYYEREAQEGEKSTGLAAVDRRAKAFISLNRITDAMSTLPPLTDPDTDRLLGFSIKSYTDEMNAAILAAAEAHYQEGLRLSALGDRENAKKASKEFLRTLEYVPGYKDALQREAAATEEAMQRLVFLPFDRVDAGYYSVDTSSIIRDTAESIIISDGEVMKYTTIVDRSQLSRIIEEQQLGLSALFDESTTLEIGNLLNANLIVTGEVTQVSRNNPTLNRQLVSRQKEVIPTAEELGREPVEGETVTVTADVAIYREYSSAAIRVSFKLIDMEKGAVVLSDTVTKEITSEARWAEYAGDERALTYNDETLVNNWDRNAKGVIELIGEAAEEAGTHVGLRLKEYLR